MTSAKRAGRRSTLRLVAASLEAAERWELGLYVAHLEQRAHTGRDGDRSGTLR